MNTKSKILGILAAGVFAASAHAADDQLVDTLVRNGFITQAQADSMKADSKSKSDKPSVSPKRKTTASMNAKVRLHWQVGYASVDSDYSDANTESYFTFENRRVRVGFDGKMNNNWKFDVFANVLPEGSNLDTGTLTYTGIDNIDIGFGFTDMEVGREESTSSSSIKTVERSLLANTFDGPRSTGVFADAGFGPVSVFAGLFNGVSDNDNALEGDGSTKVAGNFQIFLNLGEIFDGIKGDIGFQTNQFFDSDNADFDAVYSINGELKFGMFGIQADYIWGEDQGGDTTQGFMIMPYVSVTDNLELVFRYDYIDSDKKNGIGVLSRYVGRTALDDAINTDEGSNAGEADDGNEYQSFYFGANYYISGNNLKLQAGVELSELKDDNITAMESTTVYGAVRARF
ncbi:MAG: porin [Puniceicoccaceae bacterium]